MKFTTFAAILLAVLLPSYALPHLALDFGVGSFIESNEDSSSDDGKSNAIPLINFESGGLSNNPFIDFGFGIPRNIIEGLRRSASVGFSAGSQIAEALANGVSGFLRDANQFTDAVAVATQNFLDGSFNNFITVVGELQKQIADIIGKMGENVQQTMLLQVKNGLGKAVSSAKYLQAVVNKIRDGFHENIEKSANALLASWSDWAELSLSKALARLGDNREAYERIKILVDDYTNTYAGYLNRCSEDVTNEFEKFETKVNDAMEKYRAVIEELMREVQKCLRSSNSECRRNISNEFRTLRNAHRVFLKLIEEGNGLRNVDFNGLVCVRRTVEEYLKEQPEIEAKINAE